MGTSHHDIEGEGSPHDGARTTPRARDPRLETHERVTGPGNALIPIGTVILLTLATWAFLWTLHVRYFHDPVNPLSPNERAPIHQTEATANE